MAKNDMEVIAYKILSYLYECMKSGATPECSANQRWAIHSYVGQRRDHAKGQGIPV